MGWIPQQKEDTIDSAAGGTDTITFDLPDRVRNIYMASDNDTTALQIAFEIKVRAAWYPLWSVTTGVLYQVGWCTINTEMRGSAMQIRVSHTTSVAGDVIRAVLFYEMWEEEAE